jgi:hypothetical protein
MYVAKWENGKVVSGQHIFDDKLFYGGKEDWEYSTSFDRRFHSEMIHIPPPGENPFLLSFCTYYWFLTLNVITNMDMAEHRHLKDDE